MKILIDVRTLGRNPSGVGMYIYRFALGLSKYKDIELFLATDVEDSEEIRHLSGQEQVETYVFGKSVSKGLSVFKYVSFLKKLIEDVKPDIFWEPNNLLPVSFHNPYGRYVVTIHDIFPVTMPECYGLIYSLYFRHGLNKTIKSCDAVLYDTETVSKEVIRFFPESSSNESFTAFAIVPPVMAEAQKQDYFFYVGNLERRKGTDILLSAYERYLDAGGTRELYLAGKVREKKIQEQLDALLSKTVKLHYLGYIDKNERDRRYMECGCFVFPSRAEGFGLPVMEALSCGTVVLASDLPVFRETAKDMARYFSLEEDTLSIEILSKAMLEIKEDGDKKEMRIRCAAGFNEETIIPQAVRFFKGFLGSNMDIKNT